MNTKGLAASIAALNHWKDLKSQFESINFDRFEKIDWSRLDKRFASLSADPDAAAFDLYTNTSGTEYFDNMLGQYHPGTYGRWFRLAENGAGALVVGNVIQSKAYDSTFTNMAVLAAAVATSGLQQVTVTNGTTTINLNDLVTGSVSVYTAPDLNSDYIITGHTQNVTSGNAVILTLDRFLRNAWTTSTKVSIHPSPWKYVIQAPATTLTGTPAGVAVFATAATTVASGATAANPVYFTWLQTHGVGSVLSDASSILTGSQIASPSGTAGCAILASAGLAVIGVAMQPAASGHGISAFLTID